jgi:hypothetical protein
MSDPGRVWRAIGGIAVLAVLVLIGVSLLPPYFENWKLQQYLNDLSADPATAQKPADMIRANVVNKAAELGLPVHTDDVRVTRNGDGFKVDVLYVVHVDLSLYTVDLHFRPAA